MTYSIMVTGMDSSLKDTMSSWRTMQTSRLCLKDWNIVNTSGWSAWIWKWQISCWVETTQVATNISVVYATGIEEPTVSIGEEKNGHQQI